MKKQDSISNESAVIAPMFSKLKELQRTNPAFFNRLEDADTASREVLIDLLAASPTPEIKYFLLGQLTMRTALAGVGGRHL